MTTRAYLVGFVDISGPRVRWAGCGIFSEPRPTSAYFTFEIERQSGPDFPTARHHLLQLIRRAGPYRRFYEEVVRYEQGRVGCAGCFFNSVDGCTRERQSPGHAVFIPECWIPCETADETTPSGLGLITGRTYEMEAGGRAFDLLFTEDGVLSVDWKGTEQQTVYIPPGHYGDAPETERGRIPASAEKHTILLAIRRAYLDVSGGRDQTVSIIDVVQKLMTTLTGPDFARGRVGLLTAIDQELRGSDPLLNATCASWHPTRSAFLLVGYRTGSVRILEWFPESRYFEPRQSFALAEFDGCPVQTVCWMGERGHAFVAWSGRGNTTRVVEDARAVKQDPLGETLEPRLVSIDGNWVVRPFESGYEVEPWLGRGNG